MGGNERSSLIVSGRKGATAATVILAVILSLAIGGGASWFFLAGAEAQAREALRQAQEKRRQQSQLALAELQKEIQVDLEGASTQLERLNYGSAFDELQEAVDKCDLVMNALAEEDAAQARLLRDTLQQAKGLAQSGDPAVLEQVKGLRRGTLPAEGAGRRASRAEPPLKPGGEPQPEAVTPPEAPPAEEKGTTTPPQKEETVPPEKESGPQPGSPPPFAP